MRPGCWVCPQPKDDSNTPEGRRAFWAARRRFALLQHANLPSSATSSGRAAVMPVDDEGAPLLPGVAPQDCAALLSFDDELAHATTAHDGAETVYGMLDADTVRGAQPDLGNWRHRLQPKPNPNPNQVDAPGWNGGLQLVADRSKYALLNQFLGKAGGLNFVLSALLHGQSHVWPLRAPRAAFEGVRLPLALVTRGPATQIPPRGRVPGATPRQTHRFRCV